MIRLTRFDAAEYMSIRDIPRVLFRGAVGGYFRPAARACYRTISMALAALFLTGCAAPTVLSIPNSCATLLPAEWKQGVPGPELPTGDTVGDWIAFSDAAIGKLDVANGRTRDTIGIVERCEARDAAAVKKATRRWWQIF